MLELAATYPKEKIEKNLKGYKRIKKESLKELAEKAVLVNLGAITVDELNSSQNIDKLLNAYVVDYNDRSENSLGNISDKGIIEKVNKKYSIFKVIEKNSREEIRGKY